MLTLLRLLLLADEGHDVFVENLGFPVRQLLEAEKSRVDFRLGFQRDAQLVQPLLEGVAARQFSEDDLVGGPAHVFGAHDFIRLARL